MVLAADPAVRRWLALGGVLAPLAFAAAVLLSAAGRPEYHHATQAISELGELGAPRGALMNYGGFFLYGLLVIGLAAGLHRGIRGGPGDCLGLVLLAIYGAGYVAVAFAPCNPGCTGANPTANEQAHFLVSRVIMMTGFSAPLVLFPRLAKDPDWARLSWLVLALPLLAYLLFLLPLGLPFGWQQRLFVGFTLAWVLALGWRLFRVTAQDLRRS